MPAARVVVNRSALSNMLRARNGLVATIILKPRVHRVLRRAHRIVRAEAYDTGRLDRGLYGEVVQGAHGPEGRVGGREDHTMYVEKGTGVHGPKRAVIVAQPGKVFVFPDKQTGRLVFTRRIKGRKAVRMLERSLEALR